MDKDEEQKRSELTFVILPMEGDKNPSFREFVAQQNSEARQDGYSTRTIVIGWIGLGLLAAFGVVLILGLVPLFWFWVVSLIPGQLVSIEPLFPVGLYYMAALIPIYSVLLALELAVTRLAVTRLPRLARSLSWPFQRLSRESRDLRGGLVAALPMGPIYSWVATWIEGVEVTVLGGALHFTALTLTYFSGAMLDEPMRKGGY